MPESAALEQEFTVGTLIRAGLRHYDGFTTAIDVISASRTQPGSRANTADTYDAWRAVDPAAISRILVVTTDIYVPFQHCDAIRTLGLELNCAVETIGVPSGYTFSNGHRIEFVLTNYLQEVRSAIRSMRRLLAAIDGDRTLAESR